MPFVSSRCNSSHATPFSSFICCVSNFFTSRWTWRIRVYNNAGYRFPSFLPSFLPSLPGSRVLVAMGVGGSGGLECILCLCTLLSLLHCALRGGVIESYLVESGGFSHHGLFLPSRHYSVSASGWLLWVAGLLCPIACPFGGSNEGLLMRVSTSDYAVLLTVDAKPLGVGTAQSKRVGEISHVQSQSHMQDLRRKNSGSTRSD